MQALTTFQKEFIASKDTECLRIKKDIIFPTPGKHEKSKYTKDINDFIRTIKSKAHLKITSRKERRDSIHKKFFRIKVDP